MLFAVGSVSIGALLCATHGKAFAVCLRAFVVCFCHTTNCLSPVVYNTSNKNESFYMKCAFLIFLSFMNCVGKYEKKSRDAIIHSQLCVVVFIGPTLTWFDLNNSINVLSLLFYINSYN